MTENESIEGETAAENPSADISESEVESEVGVHEPSDEKTAAEEKTPNKPVNRSEKARDVLKRIVNRYFITAFSGMALGLFCTLIAGTIIGQIGSLIGDNVVGKIISGIGSAAKIIMGAGIGVGIAHSFKDKRLTMFSAAAAGMIGANVTNIFVMSGVHIWGAAKTASITVGDPVASYVASVTAIELCSLVEGKTPVDIIVIPILAIVSGAAGGIILGIPFGMLFSLMGLGISKAVAWEPISFGILISVVMGLLLTLPTSSAAFAVMLFNNVPEYLSGASQLAAAAACAGCCAHMIGFAVASFRENKWGGLVSQGIGTSMLQIPNLAKNPRILIPAVAASAVSGPLASAVFRLQCDAAGSGMGTAGLVGVISTVYTSIDAGVSPLMLTFGIIVCYFVVPALVAFGVSELLRKVGWIKRGDMKLPE